jgi:hypothetical protein
LSIHSILYKEPIPLGVKQLQSITIPLPCFIVCLTSRVGRFFLSQIQHQLMSLEYIQLILVSLPKATFFQLCTILSLRILANSNLSFIFSIDPKPTFLVVNKVIKKNRYPLSLILGLLKQLGSTKIFTKITLRDTYNLV